MKVPVELTLEQLALIGLLATVLVQGAKIVISLVARLLGKEVVLNKFSATLLAGLGSLLLAFFWAKPALPTYSDPITFVGELIVLASSLFGFATLIYVVLLKRILEALGLVEEKVLARFS